MSVLLSSGVSGLAPVVSGGLGSRSPHQMGPSPSILPWLFPQDHRRVSQRSIGPCRCSNRGIFSYWTEGLCAAPSTPRLCPDPPQVGGGWLSDDCGLLVTGSAVARALRAGAPNVRGFPHSDRAFGSLWTPTGAPGLNPTLPAEAKGGPTRRAPPPHLRCQSGVAGPQVTGASSDLATNSRGPTAPLKTQRFAGKAHWTDSGKHSGLQAFHEGCNPGAPSGGDAEAGRGPGSLLCLCQAGTLDRPRATGW